jgi:hypothetical protein
MCERRVHQALTTAIADQLTSGATGGAYASSSSAAVVYSSAHDALAPWGGSAKGLSRACTKLFGPIKWTRL